MKTVYLLRLRSSDHGTEGRLITEDGFECSTLELPWRENMKGKSCIPSGEYEVKVRVSPKYGKVYWVTQVPDRTYILIHSGNFAGNTDKGFKTHVAGCILLGAKHGWLGEQRAILNSRVYVRKFENHMGFNEFMLKVIGGEE